MVIPKKIFQSWKTKDLQGKMKENVEKIKSLNPEYEHYLYDDNDCREFLLNYFGKFYLEAFDTLIPGAFKCDFWRYCVLYIHGGVYIDIDMELLVPLKDIIDKNDEFISVKDLTFPLIPDCRIFQAFIAVKEKHPILWYASHLTFSNIISRKSDILDPYSVTGPLLMGVAINLFWGKKETHKNIRYGKYNNIIILKKDNTYTYKNNKKILKNKIEEYNRGLSDYTKVDYFNYDPKIKNKKDIKDNFLILFILFILTILIYYFIKHKYYLCNY